MTSSSIETSKTPLGYIAWFCFLGVLAVTCGACAISCGTIHLRRRYIRRMNEQSTEHDEQQHQLDAEISRIEANIKAFSERENHRRKRSFQNAMRCQMVVTIEK